MESYFCKSNPWSVELELKLMKYARQTIFAVEVQTAAGILQGRTVEFRSHNNGKVNVGLNLRNTSLDGVSFGSNRIRPEEKTVPLLFENEENDLNSLAADTLRKRKYPNTKGCKRYAYNRGNLASEGEEESSEDTEHSVHSLAKEILAKVSLQELFSAVDIAISLSERVFRWKPYTDVIQCDFYSPEQLLQLVASDIAHQTPRLVRSDTENGTLIVDSIDLISSLFNEIKRNLRDIETLVKNSQFQLQLANSKMKIHEPVKKHRISIADDQRRSISSPSVLMNRPNNRDIGIILPPPERTKITDFNYQFSSSVSKFLQSDNLQANVQPSQALRISLPSSLCIENVSSVPSITGISHFHHDINTRSGNNGNGGHESDSNNNNNSDNNDRNNCLGDNNSMNNLDNDQINKYSDSNNDNKYHGDRRLFSDSSVQSIDKFLPPTTENNLIHSNLKSPSGISVSSLCSA